MTIRIAGKQGRTEIKLGRFLQNRHVQSPETLIVPLDLLGILHHKVQLCATPCALAGRNHIACTPKAQTNARAQLKLCIIFGKMARLAIEQGTVKPGALCDVVDIEYHKYLIIHDVFSPP